MKYFLLKRILTLFYLYPFIVYLFPAAIARFCEAILDFLADEQHAVVAKIRTEDFEGQVFSAYEQLFNVWLQSKEASKEAKVNGLSQY